MIKTFLRTSHAQHAQSIIEQLVKLELAKNMWILELPHLKT